MPKPTITVPEGDPPTSLEIVDDVVGDGTEASPGNTVSVHYVGVAWSTGSQFDASWDRMEPFRSGSARPGDPGLGPGCGRDARRRAAHPHDPSRISATGAGERAERSRRTRR